MDRLIARSSATREPRLANDARGAVYVEFLIAFMPLFLLFLAVCQLTLIASARLVVQHAALSGARSAIVVLEAPPEEFDDAPRGSLSEGRADSRSHLLALLSALHVGPSAASSHLASGGDVPQQGARMAPIRTAAYMSLLTLAPQERALGTAGDSVAKSIPSTFVGQMGFAIDYTRSASVVSVHVDSGSELPPEPIGRNAPITVRVTYLYHCGVPLVRSLMCDALVELLGSGPRSFLGIPLPSEPSALGQRMKLSEGRSLLEQLAAPSDRFTALSAEATLPNQGAGYHYPETE